MEKNLVGRLRASRGSPQLKQHINNLKAWIAARKERNLPCALLELAVTYLTEYKEILERES